MIKFFDYCFYRIATTKYVRKVDPKYPWIMAFGWISLCQLSNILTVINIYHLCNNLTFEAKPMVITVGIPIYIINIFLLTKKNVKVWWNIIKKKKIKQ